MTIALALVLAAAIALPHALRLDRAPPLTAALVWLATLGLRALAGIFSVLFVVLFLPTTELFSLVTHWCWHAVVPFIATHLGLNGHRVGDIATLAPAFVLTLSLLSVIWAVWRAARAVGRLVTRRAVGIGPSDSVIVGGRGVLVASAGLTRPRVVVSTDALTTFDDEELAAGLAHEQGHIERRHRYLLLAGELCRALGRFVPGTRRASAELVFHLERDADEYAIARQHDPLALASAICKAAANASPAAAPLMALGGNNGLTKRLRLLSGEGQDVARSSHGIRGVATGLAVLVVALAAAVPAVAAAGVDQLDAAPIERHCPE